MTPTFPYNRYNSNMSLMSNEPSEFDSVLSGKELRKKDYSFRRTLSSSKSWRAFSKSTTSLRFGGEEKPKRSTGPSKKRLSLTERGLPKGFACNPIMVNFTRSRLGFSILQRSTRLDRIAKQHACEMAARDQLFSFLENQKRSSLRREMRRTPMIWSIAAPITDETATDENLDEKLDEEKSKDVPTRGLSQSSGHRFLDVGDDDDEFFKTMIVGENLSSGKSIIQMHRQGLTKVDIGKNLTEANYREMGMGTAKSATGELYMCQLFR